MTKYFLIFIFLLIQYFSSIAGVHGLGEYNKSLYGTVSQCNGKKHYNQEFTCCNGHLHKGTELLCCGDKVFNPCNATCCNNVTGSLTSLSQCVSNCCGAIAFNPLNQLCCGTKILPKTVACAECCDGGVIDPARQMCCGSLETEKILKRKTKDHRCCGEKEYNQLTDCCCYNETTKKLEVEKSTSSCCKPPGSSNPTVPNPICSDGQIDESWKKQCSPSGRLHWRSERTVCGSFHYDSPGQHCCGETLLNPETEVCCNGIRHPRGVNSHCCGVKPYIASDDQVKCCKGTLHHLTQLGGAGKQHQCCNNVLMDSKFSTCCEGLTYSTQPMFSCCGKNYYNTSLWSCCAGELDPVPETKDWRQRVHNGTKLEQLESLNTTQICKGVLIGTVVSVSVKNQSRPMVMTNVLQFNASEGHVEIPTSPYILSPADHCSSDRLELGKTYIWDADPPKFFSEVHPSNVLHSLHLILSLCQSSKVTSNNSKQRK